MVKVKVLGRIGEFDEKHLPALKAVIEKGGGSFLRLKTIPDSEHWLEYHCRFRNKVKGLRKFARRLVQYDVALAERREQENAKRAAEGKEPLPAIEPLPTEWPNEERRAFAGSMLEQFLDHNSSIRRDLDAPEGAYEQEVAYEKVDDLLVRLKMELAKDFEDTEG